MITMFRGEDGGKLYSVDSGLTWMDEEDYHDIPVCQDIHSPDQGVKPVQAQRGGKQPLPQGVKTPDMEGRRLGRPRKWTSCPARF